MDLSESAAGLPFSCILRDAIVKQTKISEELTIITNNQKEIIEKQRRTIKNFRNSIVYPFFTITSSIGRTKIGKIISRIIK